MCKLALSGHFLEATPGKDRIDCLGHNLTINCLFQKGKLNYGDEDVTSTDFVNSLNTQKSPFNFSPEGKSLSHFLENFHLNQWGL